MAHRMSITPTELRGMNSGRIRYRVECWTCGVVVHEATTGPQHMVAGHLAAEDGTPAYGRPMTAEEQEQDPMEHAR